MMLKFNPIFMAPPNEGWVKKERTTIANPGPGQHKAAKPDKPRNVDTRYPSGYIVPFHFKHPVTGKKTSEARRNAKLIRK
jgi:hypothetical protein